MKHIFQFLWPWPWHHEPFWIFRQTWDIERQTVEEW